MSHLPGITGLDNTNPGSVILSLPGFVLLSCNRIYDCFSLSSLFLSNHFSFSFIYMLHFAKHINDIVNMSVE